MSEKRFSLKEWEDLNYCEHCFYDGESQLSDSDVVVLLNEQQSTIKDLERKLQICSAHLLSDECCLTDKQIREIIKEMTNE